MAEEKMKSLFDSESVSVAFGAIVGGLSLKLIPASYVASLGKWTGIVFGIIPYSIGHGYLIVDIKGNIWNELPQDTAGKEIFKIEKNLIPDQMWIIKPEIFNQIEKPYFKYEKEYRFETYYFAFKIAEITDWHIINVINICDEKREEDQMTAFDLMKKQNSKPLF